MAFHVYIFPKPVTLLFNKRGVEWTVRIESIWIVTTVHSRALYRVFRLTSISKLERIRVSFMLVLQGEAQLEQLVGNCSTSPSRSSRVSPEGLRGATVLPSAAPYRPNKWSCSFERTKRAISQFGSLWGMFGFDTYVFPLISSSTCKKSKYFIILF